MAVTFTIEQLDSYLYVELMGSMRTSEDAANFWTPFRERCVELGVKRILVDYSKLDFGLDYYGMVRLSKYAQEQKFQYHLFRIAVVVSSEDLKAAKDYRIPALNRGFSYQPFTDLDEAKAWLLEQ